MAKNPAGKVKRTAANKAVAASEATVEAVGAVDGPSPPVCVPVAGTVAAKRAVVAPHVKVAAPVEVDPGGAARVVAAAGADGQPA